MKTIAYLIGYNQAKLVLYSGQSKIVNPVRYAEENVKKCEIKKENMEDFIRGITDSKAQYDRYNNKMKGADEVVKKNASIKEQNSCRNRHNDGGVMMVLGLLMGHRHRRFH
jgi:hypothetical protein